MTRFLAVAAVGFAAAACVALVAAASGLAVGWPQASLACLPCIADHLYNEFGIPGAVFGGVAAAVVTISVGGIPTPGGALFGGGFTAGEVTGDNVHPPFDFRSDGDRVTTYLPGVSPLPEKGDVIYVPSIGASKVTDVYYDPDRYQPDGSPGGVVIVTELGPISVGMIPSER